MCPCGFHCIGTAVEPWATDNSSLAKEVFCVFEESRETRMDLAM